jgi:hypothetical protein
MNTTIADKKINLNILSREEKKALVKTTYKKNSYFQQLFNADHAEFKCEKFAIGLRNQIERILIEKQLAPHKIPLEQLHDVLSDEMKTYNFNDGVNKISTYFYETDEQFMHEYHQFIKFLREQIVTEPFWFQAIPTIRIHCPDGKNNNHYPRYHTDIGYGHPPEEMNLWIPLTDILTGHGFRIMSLAASKKIIEQFDFDFEPFIDNAINNKNFSNNCDTLSEPVTTELGSVIAFDSRCIHTGEPLKTHTRVSIDIRILPISQYEQMNIEYQGSGRRKILFTPGNCYNKHHSDYFLNK